MKTELWKKIGVWTFLVLMIVLWVGILSFKSPEPPPSSYQQIMTIDKYTHVYKLSIDGVEYILVSGGSSSMSITKAH